MSTPTRASENPTTEPMFDEQCQYVVFSLEDEEYGVKIDQVREIIGYKKPTLLPNAEAYVAGVINLRGTVVPVIDLRIRLNMPSKEHNEFTVILVVEVFEKRLGLIVDAVSDVLSFAKSEIREPPDFEASIRTDFICGLAQKDTQLFILLDIDTVLSFETDESMERESA